VNTLFLVGLRHTLKNFIILGMEIFQREIYNKEIANLSFFLQIYNHTILFITIDLLVKIYI